MSWLSATLRWGWVVCMIVVLTVIVGGGAGRATRAGCQDAREPAGGKAQSSDTSQSAEKQGAEKKGAEKNVGPAADGDAAWISLLDAKTGDQWQVLEKFEFRDHGQVKFAKDQLSLAAGELATGVRWKGKFPRDNFVLECEARRVAGSDFFCGLTFPVGKESLTLVAGGWGGWVIGLSCLDGTYAIDNETCQSVEFKQNRWYRFQIQVTKEKVQVWVDTDRLIDLRRGDYRLSVSGEMEECLPLGLSTWRTGSEVRKLRYRSLK